MGLRAYILRQIGNQQPGLIRYLKIAAPAAADDIRQQIMNEFGFIPAPILLHSPLPDLFAGMWILLRENLIVGTLPREYREAISLVVSDQNRCPFCEDSHTMTLKGLRLPGIATAISRGELDRIEDKKLAKLLTWVKAGFEPDGGHARAALPRFPPEALPEIIGAIVGFHYLNRVVNVFLKDSPLPGPKSLSPLRKFLQWAGGRTFESLFRAEFAPGESLHFLPEAELPPDLAWAAENPNLTAAFARFDRAIETAAQAALSEEARQLLAATLLDWGQKQPGMGADWLDHATNHRGLTEREQILSRLGLMAALASYRVTEKDIEAARIHGATDPDLLATVAWASFAKAKQIGTAIAANARADEKIPSSC